MYICDTAMSVLEHQAEEEKLQNDRLWCLYMERWKRKWRSSEFSWKHSLNLLNWRNKFYFDTTAFWNFSDMRSPGQIRRLLPSDLEPATGASSRRTQTEEQAWSYLSAARMHSGNSCTQKHCELGTFATRTSVKLIILSDNESRAPQG